MVLRLLNISGCTGLSKPLTKHVDQTEYIQQPFSSIATGNLETKNNNTINTQQHQK